MKYWYQYYCPPSPADPPPYLALYASMAGSQEETTMACDSRRPLHVSLTEAT